jgi:adenylylsulfate kinase
MIADSPKTGLIVWLTGMSSAGKTTLAHNLEVILSKNRLVEILDGDVFRSQGPRDLGFSKHDRDENVRRIASAAKDLSERGTIVIVAAISPYRAARDAARNQLDAFVEVYVNAPLEVCESRDVKGLYRRARAGTLIGLTGVDDPYEPPIAPEVECRTDLETIEESIEKILRHITPLIGPVVRKNSVGTKEGAQVSVE